MDTITTVIFVFSILGAVDYIFGSKFGLGTEFEKAFALFCPMALCTLGMLVISPAIGVWLTPVFEGFYNLFGLDPSIIPASLFANDMGGMALAQSFCKTAEIGNYNAFIVASTMGCVISFTIPFSIGVVKPHQHKELFFGLICGIITVPIGCFVAGLLCGLPPFALLINLLPLILFAILIGILLIFLPGLCIKCFGVFGRFMKTLGVIGLMCAIFTFLTKIELNPHLGTLESAAMICVNACVTFSGALPVMFLVSRLLNKPLNKLGSKIGINGVAALAFLGSLITNATCFGTMDKMDKKGAVLNSAFSVSASFALGSHLAFTMAFEPTYVIPMILGKLISGVCAVILALLVYKGGTQEAA